MQSGLCTRSKVHITEVQAFNGQGLIQGTCVLGFAGKVALSLVDAAGNRALIYGDLVCAKPVP